MSLKVGIIKDRNLVQSAHESVARGRICRRGRHIGVVRSRCPRSVAIEVWKVRSLREGGRSERNGPVGI